MQCPYCHEDNDRVVNSRPSTDGACVKRRRECEACHRRYTTYERIEMSVLRVVKKDGTREEFSHQKLLEGLNKACYKRPISTERVQELVDEIERDLHQRYEGEAPSQAIGELAMAKLMELDHVAYIRFASVYREFADATDFVEEADSVLQEGGGGAGKQSAERAGAPPS